MEREPHPPTLKLIIAYKLVRAGLSALAAAAIPLLLLAGFDAPLQRLAAQAKEHAVSALSVELAGLLGSAVEPRHVLLVAGALGLDAVSTFVEGWALHRSWRWGAWLVVASSSVLLPFEVDALVHKVSPLRATLLVVNLAIVAYLLVRTWRRWRRR